MYRTMNQQRQAAPEISSGLVELAARVKGAGGRSSTHRFGTRVRGFSSGGFFRCTCGRRCPARNRTGTTGSGDRYGEDAGWLAATSAESSALGNTVAGTTPSDTIPLPVTG